MKKLITAVVIIALLGFTGYFAYQWLMPKIIAEAVVSESLPNYIPKRLKTKVDAIRTPINKGTEAIIQKMHASDIPLERVLEAVDNVTEEQAYSFLDEVNKRKPKDTNGFFDIAKKHFSANIEMEIFREPFTKHFEMKQVKEAISYANLNRKSNDVDLATAKAIFKKIIVEKEKEVLSTQ